MSAKRKIEVFSAGCTAKLEKAPVLGWRKGKVGIEISGLGN